MRKKSVRRWMRLREFMDKQGGAFLATLCVIVITATAVWTARRDEAYVAPAPPTAEAYYASQLMQQRMSEAATPTPLPTTRPPLWEAPLPSISVLQPFSASMVRSSWSGVWAVHDSADLGAEPGTPVKAMAPGVVSGTGEDPLEGVWLSIRHADGYESRYAALSLTGAFRAGDEVRTGQTIGFVGNTAACEEPLGPHLHLQVFCDGKSIDPLSLLD